jgi:PEP-CTERM motif
MGRGTRAAIVLAALVVCAGTARHAFGDQFDVTWTGGYGPGNAIVTATEQPDDVTWDVTSIMGEQNGAAITGLSNYGGADNLIFPTSFELVDEDGFAFTTASYSYDIFENPLELFADAECSSQFNGACITIDEFGPAPVLTSFTITPVTSAPEPGSMMLLTLGLFGVVAAGMYRKRSSTGMLA